MCKLDQSVSEKFIMTVIRDPYLLLSLDEWSLIRMKKTYGVPG